MVISDHFVYIHLPKTGGTFIRRMLVNKFLPKTWKAKELKGGHLVISDIPPTHADLPIFGFVRNPYDWYVSWYYHQKNKDRSDFFNEVSDNGKKDFKSTMMTMAEMDAHEAFKNDFDTSKYEVLGAYTAIVLATYGEDLDVIQLGRFENLRDDFLSIMSNITDVNLLFRLWTKHYPKLNKSSHTHYSHYYDNELREIMAEKDKLIFDRFGYAFEEDN